MVLTSFQRLRLGFTTPARIGTIGVLCIVALETTVGFAQEVDSARLSASIDSLVVQLRRGTKIPGIVILAAHGPKALFVKGYGFANLDLGIPAGPATVAGIGSITKQFVAAAILKLAEEGRVHLDDPVTRYIPEFSLAAGGATLHHLLNHTSGIRGGVPYPGRNPNRIDYTRTELRQTLGELYKDRPPEFPPGQAWEYQSINYNLLGLVIEHVTGQTLWDHLRERFFKPLGMRATAQCDPSRVTKSRATGYVQSDSVPEGVFVAEFASPTIALGSVGLCSTVFDLLKWQRALVEHRALSAESYAQMTRPGELDGGHRTDYGYGFALWNIGGEPNVFHTGGVPGYTAYLGYLPASDLTVAVLINSNSNIFTIGPAVIRAARGLPPVPDLPSTHQERARYVGRYESEGIEVIVSELDEHLSAETNGSNSYRFLFDPLLLKQGDRDFAVEWEPGSRLEFRQSRGVVDGAVLRYGGRTVQLRRTK